MQDLTNAGDTPYAVLTRYMWSYRFTQALYVAAKLGIAELVYKEPKTAGELAVEVGADEMALTRLLRALTTINVFVEDEKSRFGLTSLGDLLRKDHPNSVYEVAIMQCEPSRWAAWGDLLGTVVSGEPAFPRIHGESLFSYFEKHPDEGVIFNGAMTRMTNHLQSELLNVYSFSQFHTIVDVAGGQGMLLKAILERYPEAKGILCDVPSVLDSATALKNSEVASRCQFIPVDMFKSLPAGGDAYILKYIIHDWNDDECIQILRNCRTAIKGTGKLLVIDRVIKPSNQPDPAKWTDLNMMILLTGKERTEEEFRRLFAESGFRLERVIEVAEHGIMEGIPV